MKISDSQFARYFLLHEVDLPSEVTADILEKQVDVQSVGEPDTVSRSGGAIIIHNPSSFVMFLYRMLESALSGLTADGYHRDKMGMALLHMCRDYAYKNHKVDFSGPTILLDVDKIIVPSTIIRDIIEPLVGHLDASNVLFAPCFFTDAARVISSSRQLENEYDVEHLSLGYHEFPVVLVNASIYNKAAQNAHLVVKILESSLGIERSKKVIKNILLNERDGIISLLLMALKIGEGDPGFVMDFVQHLQDSTNLTPDEVNQAIHQQSEVIASDTYLSQHIKVAQMNSPQVFRQWSQWSMLMGLIEKQLQPMRGSMWPTSENVKPHEDRLRLMIKERAAEKGKSQANFEDMLESARDLYDHNAVEPGQLIETMLKENRVWKL